MNAEWLTRMKAQFNHIKVSLQKALSYFKWLKQAEREDEASLSQQDLDFLEDSRRAMLTDSHWLTYGLLYSIGLIFIIFIIWAKFAVLDEITTAQGKVIPSSQIQVIQNLDGGIVAAIYIKEGNIVQKNQVLMRLDDTRYASAYREGLAKYWALVASVARLKAEESHANKINFPEKLIEARPDLVDSETRLFQQHLQALQANLETLQKSYNLAKEALDINKPLVKEGLISQIELLQNERDVNDLQGKIKNANEEFENKAHDALNEQMAQLDALHEAIIGLKDRMIRTTIRSPVYGTIKKLNVSTIGGVIQPGMDIIEIVPLEDTLLIEAKVKPADIAFIRPDQQAMVKFTAYDYAIYGGLAGKVEYISADSIKDDDNLRDKETYYKILVRTKINYLGRKEAPLPIIPGMTATVDIKTGKKTVLEYLLNPITKARSSALRER